jgi:hypothetical protein
MRVKLCARCPYTPRDVATHYEAEAALHLCARCDSQHEASTSRYPRKAYRRQPCATVPNVFATALQGAARSVTEGLVSSGTIPAEPPSVQKSALIASSSAGTATAAGSVHFKPRPENGPTEQRMTNFRTPGFRSSDTEFCFTPGGAT